MERLLATRDRALCRAVPAGARSGCGGPRAKAADFSRLHAIAPGGTLRHKAGTAA